MRRYVCSDEITASASLKADRESEAGEKVFSVCQFFQNGTYQYVRRWVSATEAIQAAGHYAQSVGAQLGTTRRVIITDDDDCTNWEWRYGEGIVFPPPSHANEGSEDPRKVGEADGPAATESSRRSQAPGGSKEESSQ